MKTKMIVVGCAAVLIAVAAQAETGGGAFRFLNGEGDALSLFGVRLGQKMAAADTCPPWHNHLTARSDQTDAMVFDRTGFAWIVPDTPCDAKPWWGYHGPAVDLYRKHQSAKNSTTSLFARQLAVSEKLLKSERIAATTNKFANAQNVGCFDSVHVSRDSTYCSGAEAEYDLDGYSGSKISIDGRLYLFKSNGDAFNFGIAQLVNEPLPASVLAGKVKILRDIPDMCFIRNDGLPSSRWRDSR